MALPQTKDLLRLSGSEENHEITDVFQNIELKRGKKEIIL